MGPIPRAPRLCPHSKLRVGASGGHWGRGSPHKDPIAQGASTAGLGLWEALYARPVLLGPCSVPGIPPVPAEPGPVPIGMWVNGAICLGQRFVGFFAPPSPQAVGS